MDVSLAQNSTRITLEIEGALSPDQILEVLVSNSGNFIDHYVCQHNLLNGLTDHKLYVFVNAAVTVTTQLRAYVSEWIDTAVDKDGTERPLLRSLELMSSSTRLAIEAFQAKYPIRTKIVDLDKPTQRIACDVGCLSVLKGERSLSAHAHDAALTWAQSLFVALLMSSWKHRLCVCRRCRNYLMLPRAPKENPYQHGVTCDSCAGAASAVANTREVRIERRELLTILAAEVCSDLKLACNTELIKHRSVEIAKKVSATLGRVPGKHYRGKRIGEKSCSGKWVRTYASEIAEEQVAREVGREGKKGKKAKKQ